MLDSTTDDAPLLHDFDKLKEPAWKKKNEAFAKKVEQAKQKKKDKEASKNLARRLHQRAF